MINKFLIFIALSFASLANAISLNDLVAGSNSSEPVPVDVAFPLEVSKIENGFKFLIDIKESHYLYKNKFKLKINDEDIKMTLPKGDVIHDEFFGETEVYHYGFELIVDYNKNVKDYKLDFEMQGCASHLNLCYPVYQFSNTYENVNYDPTLIKTEEKVIDVKNIENSKINEKLTLKDIAQTNNVEEITEYIKENKSSPFILLSFVLIGLLIAFTPCVYPMMPVIMATTASSKNPKIASAYYVLGVILAYAAIGLVAGLFSFNIQIALQNEFTSYIVSGVLLIGSFYLFGLFNKIMPSEWLTKLNTVISKINIEKDRNQIAVGFLSSLLLSPCSVAPLLGVLVFINQMGEPLFGALLLGLMGLGVGIPLFVLNTSLRKILPNNGNWMNAVKDILAYAMLGISFYVVYNPVNEFFNLIVLNIFGFLIFWKGLSLLDLETKKKIAAILIVVSIGCLVKLNFNLETKIENSDQLQKNESLLNVVNVDNLNDYNNLINNANKPIFVDFYADWCITCVRLENNVLNKEKLIKYLNNNFLVLKIDLTDISSEERELMNYHNIIAIPYYVFMDKNKKASVYTGDLSYDDFFDILKMNNEAGK